jgi:hypothetical protein
MNDLMPLYSSFSFPPLLGVPEAPAESYPSSPSLRDGFSERHLLGSPVNSRSQLSPPIQSYFRIAGILLSEDAIAPPISESKDSGYRFRERRRFR